MKISFTAFGEPFGKQRPRHSRLSNTTYTPTETKQHERDIVIAYRAQCGGFHFPADSYISLQVAAFMKIPRGASEAKRKLMLDGIIRPTKKPDWDNIGKLVADALNGVAYDDDKCIVDACVRKFYADMPRTVVTLSLCEEPTKNRQKPELPPICRY